MGARDVFVSDARLQVGYHTVILANGTRFIMFLYAIHTIETRAKSNYIIVIDYAKMM